MKEIWKPVRNWEDYYLVSNKGFVYSLKSKRLLTLDKNNTGYYRVSFYNKGKKERVFIHRLVAETFIPNPENKKQVNHINEDKSDNSVKNLEWTTQEENELHSMRRGSKGHYCGIIMIIFMDGSIKYFESARSVARFLNTSAKNVRNWLRGRKRTLFLDTVKDIKLKL